MVAPYVQQVSGPGRERVKQVVGVNQHLLSGPDAKMISALTAIPI